MGVCFHLGEGDVCRKLFVFPVKYEYKQSTCLAKFLALYPRVSKTWCLMAQVSLLFQQTCCLILLSKLGIAGI